MILILNSQRPFLTTWYTFGKGGTLFATKLFRMVLFWLRELYLVVPFISAGKKGGGGGGGGGGEPNFSKGDRFFSENIGPSGPLISEIFGPGGLILGGPIVT